MYGKKVVDYLDYLATMEPRARDIILEDAIKNDGVYVPRFHVWACGGNGNDAIILSQIRYWSGLNTQTGKVRITHRFKDHLWIVKTHKDYEDETGIKSRTIQDVVARLSNRHNLIIVEHHLSPFKETHGDSTKVSFIRINWKEYVRKLDEFVASLGRTTENGVPDGSTENGVPEETDSVDPIYTENTTETNITETTSYAPAVDPVTELSDNPTSGMQSTTATDQFDKLRGMEDILKKQAEKKAKADQIVKDRKTEGFTALEEVITSECGTNSLTEDEQRKLAEQVKYYNPETKEHELVYVNELYDNSPAYQNWITKEIIPKMYKMRHRKTGKIAKSKFIRAIQNLSEFASWYKREQKFETMKREDIEEYDMSSPMDNVYGELDE